MDSSEPLSKGQGCEAQLTSDRDRRASAIQSCRSPRSAIGRMPPAAVSGGIDNAPVSFLVKGLRAAAK